MKKKAALSINLLSSIAAILFNQCPMSSTNPTTIHMIIINIRYHFIDLIQMENIADWCCQRCGAWCAYVNLWHVFLFHHINRAEVKNIFIILLGEFTWLIAIVNIW